MKMKIFFLSLYILMASSISHAQQLDAITSFLNSASTNPAKAYSAKFSLPAYIKDISVITTKNNDKVSLVELGSDNINGIIVSWGRASLICALPIDEAAKLQKRSRVIAQGEVIDIKKRLEFNKIIGANTERLDLYASCMISTDSSEVPPATTKPSPSNQIPPPLPTKPSASGTLCKDNEEVIFSCSTGRKIISVCGTKIGAVQYRFGTQDAVEITLPETTGEKPTAGHITYASSETNFLRFTKGNTHYVVYSGEGSGWLKEGVSVEQGGKKIANVSCKTPSIGRLTFQNLPMDQEGFEIP